MLEGIAHEVLTLFLKGNDNKSLLEGRKTCVLISLLRRIYSYASRWFDMNPSYLNSMNLQYHLKWIFFFSKQIIRHRRMVINNLNPLQALPPNDNKAPSMFYVPACRVHMHLSTYIMLSLNMWRMDGERQHGLAPCKCKVLLPSCSNMVQLMRLPVINITHLYLLSSTIHQIYIYLTLAIATFPILPM